jgi:three-Cys-motif partner protein
MTKLRVIESSDMLDMASDDLRSWRCPEKVWSLLQREPYFDSFFSKPAAHSRFKLAVLKSWLEGYLKSVHCNEQKMFMFDLFAGCGGNLTAAGALEHLGTAAYLLSAALRQKIPLANLYFSEVNRVFHATLQSVLSAMLSLAGPNVTPLHVKCGPWGRELIRSMNRYAAEGADRELFLVCDQFGYKEFPTRYLHKLSQFPARLHVLLYVGFTRTLSSDEVKSFGRAFRGQGDKKTRAQEESSGTRCTCDRKAPYEAPGHVMKHLSLQLQLLQVVLESIPSRFSTVHSLVFKEDFYLTPTACCCGGRPYIVGGGSKAATYALIFASTEPQSTEIMRAAFSRFSDPRYPPCAREECFGTPFVHSAASGDRYRVPSAYTQVRS